MEIEKLVVGTLEANCYILKIDNKCLLIDPGDNYGRIKEKLDGYKLLAILLTHGHFDHTNAMREVLRHHYVEVYKKSNLEEKATSIGPFAFEPIFTPGHSNDSISFYFPSSKAMFTGDFIFKNTIGRSDLPTGSIKDMENSIKKIKNYDKDIVVYPGHGDISILGQEFENNEELKQWI